MKIIIDIPDKIYNDLRSRREANVADINTVFGAISGGIVLPQCNQCKYYEGVHNCQGHAPCSYPHTGGVLWNGYCSQFEGGDKK